MDISIPDTLKDWIDAQVEVGNHESANAYVAELIRRDQLLSADLDELLAALAAGEESGISSRRVPDIMKDLKVEIGVGR